ncbi:hypothetical protein D3C81_1502330 [compost metagenome]
MNNVVRTVDFHQYNSSIFIFSKLKKVWTQKLNKATNCGKRITYLMSDRSRNLAQHRQLIVLVSCLFNLLVIRYILYTEQEISIHLISISNGNEPVSSIFIN